jgi:hypothetical protein
VYKVLLLESIFQYSLGSVLTLVQVVIFILDT